MEARNNISRPQCVIVAIAAACAMLGVWRNDGEAAFHFRFPPQALARVPFAQQHWPALRRVLSDCDALFAIATLGLGIAVLSNPRSLRTREWPPPGYSAVAVGAIAEMLALGWNFWLDCLLFSRFGPRTSSFEVIRALAWVGARTQGAILGAWVVLALSGRFRPRQDWLDRTACFVTAGWLLSTLLKFTWPQFWTP